MIIACGICHHKNNITLSTDIVAVVAARRYYDKFTFCSLFICLNCCFCSRLFVPVPGKGISHFDFAMISEQTNGRGAGAGGGVYVRIYTGYNRSGK